MRMKRHGRENLITKISLFVGRVAAIMGISSYAGDPRSMEIGFEIEFSRLYLRATKKI